MKNKLVKILSTAILGTSLFFAPIKAADAADLSFYGEAAIDLNGSSSVSVQHVPDSISDPSGHNPQPDNKLGNMLLEGSLELRAGIKYTNPDYDWFDFKIGPKVDFSFNSGFVEPVSDEYTSGFTSSGYFYGLSKTPNFSINLGLFARASFFHDLLFAEYSASFGNEVSIVDGTTETNYNGGGLTVNGNPEAGTMVTTNNIKDSYKLGDYIDHSIDIGIHLPIKKGAFFELYGGLDIPQITSTTTLGNKFGLSSHPDLKVGIKAGFEIN